MNPSERSDRTWNSASALIGNGLLSVVMPVYNLAGSAFRNIRAVHDVFAGRIPFEIVAVDDGSADGTADEVRKAADAIPEVKAVCLTHNSGKGAAIIRACEQARGSHVLFLDGDLDLPPDQAPRFFEVMAAEKADIVIGSKRHPESQLAYPWHRKLTSSVYFFLVKALIGLPVHDTQTGMKLFRREVLDYVLPRLLVKQFAFDLELLAIAHSRGFRTAEAPVIVNFRGTLGCVRPSTVMQVMHDTLAIFYRLRILRYYAAIPERTMPEPPPLISIVVAFPAPSRYLDECVPAVLAQDYARFELLLLPDSPSGRRWPDNVREIPTGKMRPAEKRNIGTDHARGEIVAFLDDDAYPADRWLSNAVLNFSDPNVAAVGGPASTPPDDGFLQGLGGRVYALRCVSGNYRYRYVQMRMREVNDFPSCNLFVRMDFLKRIGGFRTDFWPGEDTYLCMDIKRLGGRTVYDPRVHVFHHRRGLFLPHLRQIGRYALHRGYFARHFPQTSRRLSYAMPSLLVFGLAVGGVLSFFCPYCRMLYFAGCAGYLLATLACSFHFNPAVWLLSWAGAVLTHMVYGVRFVIGTLTPRLPGQVRPFDHVSETADSRK